MTFRHILAAAAAAFVIGSASFAAHAQETAPAQTGPSLSGVAVIDMNRIREESLAFKDINRQIEEHRGVFRAEIQKEEEALRETNKELNRQRSILSPEAFTAERVKFETKLSEVQRRVQELRRDLEQSRAAAMAELQGALNRTVADIAKEQSLELVVRRDQTVLVATSLDITGLVLDQINKALPSVEVPEPGR
ncbi:MAG: OmpH/Skp family outer membrane protein [Rhodospirillales bacterium]